MKTFFSNHLHLIIPQNKISYKIFKMEMQQLLMSKASEAIAALWLNQLEIIHKSTGIEMDVLVNCLNMQVNVEPAKEPEKKKRAPAKKKEPAAPAVEPAVEPVEPDAAVEPVVEPAVEKKKRAPAKKKQEEVLDDKAKKEQLEKEALEKKANKEKEALEKKEKKEKEAQEKKAKKEKEALEKKAKKEEEKKAKEAEALEKKGKKAAEALEKKAAPKAQEKKGKKAVAAVAAAPLPKFGANEQVRYVRPNGKTVDVVVEYAIQHDDYVEYRLQVVGKNETILSREESLFELEEKVADPDSSDDDDADTVKMAASPQASPCKPAEEVVINGTSYLIDGDDTAYLKSSNKMAGKYDRVRHTIGQAQPEDDSECGESDEDELPGDMSDLSDSDSGSESGSESD
jgi:hypothetical protein